jgi:hypothetical protein
MKRNYLISSIFSCFIVVVSAWAVAEELEGTFVAPQTGEVLSQTNSSLAQAEARVEEVEKTAREIEKTIEHEIRHNISAPEFKSPETKSDFNELILVPIVSVIVVFGGGFAFIIYLFILRNRAAAQRRSQQQEQIQRFIDAGRDVPNELLRDIEGYESYGNLAKGIKNTLIGIAIVIFLTVLVGFSIGAAGLIIVAAGLARIIIWKLTQPKNS